MRPQGLLKPGLVVLAANGAVQIAVGLWQDAAYRHAEATQDFAGTATFAALWRWAWAITAMAQIAGLAIACTAPRASRARGVFVAATVVGVIANLPLFVGDSLWDAVYQASASLGRLVFAVTSMVNIAADALLAVALVLVARWCRSRVAAVMCWVALGLDLLRIPYVVAGAASVGAKSTLVSDLHLMAVYLAQALLVASAGWLAAKLPAETPMPANVGGAGAGTASAAHPTLAPQWLVASTGTAVYLSGAGIRILLALGGFVSLATARTPNDLSDLRPLHDQVVGLGVLSGLASVVMLVGLILVARVPSESRAAGPAGLAAVLAFLGALLDAATSTVMADALGGNLSAAFFAQDAAPWLVFFSAALGVATGAALLTSFARMAAALGLREVEKRARDAIVLVLVAGGLIAVAMLGGKLSGAVVVLFGLVAVPIAIAASVQFLRVAFAVRGTIVARCA